MRYATRTRAAARTTTALALSACLLAACEPTPPAEPPQMNHPAAQLDATPGPPLPENAEIEKAGTVPPKEASTQEPIGSFRPDDKSAKERVPEIIKRGRLIVGVDRSNNLLSYRDAATGEVRGFEVGIAREIARDIFGDPTKVDFRFVESSERAQVLNDRSVDLVIRTMTISAERQREVAFSIPYMATDARLLVLTSSGINSIEETSGRTLCAVQGSTSLDTIRTHAPGADILQPRSWGDCLMALQLGQTDGIVVDDALLSGMLAQDSYASIVGEPLQRQYYGVAARRPDAFYDSRPLLRQVNSTLERIRQDGTWSMLFQQWLGEYMDQPTLPEPKYRKEDSDARTEEKP